MNKPRWMILIIVWLAIYGNAVLAHSGSTGYLELNVDGELASGHFWVSLVDLQAVMGLDQDGDSTIRYGEVLKKNDAITAFAANHWQAKSAGEDCTMDWRAVALSRLDDGVYAKLPVAITCPSGANLASLHYTGLFNLDTSHRVIAKLVQAQAVRTLVFSPNDQALSWQFGTSAWWNTIVVYLEQGVIHILEGYDHLLFLLALLVPIVVSRRDKHPMNGSRLASYRPLAVDLIKVVTAFTLGHSVTLILASLLGIKPPGAWVESIIAISVVIAGINILVPLFRESSWRVAALFGLVHGFGFASVLAELTLDRGSLALSLFSFNLGVELGQLLVVAIATPLLVLLARGNFIPALARYGAAGTAVIIGSLWVVDRIPI